MEEGLCPAAVQIFDLEALRVETVREALQVLGEE